MRRCAVVKAAILATLGLPMAAANADSLSLAPSTSDPLYLQAEAPTDKPAVAKTGETEPPPTDPNTGALTLTGGVDFTTAYFFRGYNQEDTGLIAQPWVTLTANVVTNDDYTINVYIADWNSFHSKKTGADDTGPNSWYESDIYGGVDLICGKWTLGTVYTFYTYPGGAFDTIQELGFKVGYDDTDLTKDSLGFALKPYAGVYFETADGNGTEDTYGEIGIAPSFPLNDVYEGLVISFPAKLGLSLDDYYLDSDGDNEFLGYGSISVLASIPLPLGEKYGAWTLTGGIEYIQLFADGLEAVNDGGTDYELLGKVGVSFAY